MRVIYYLLSILFVSTACRFSESGTDQQPNIILIIADDMNWNDCGAYGHPHIRTPNIDKLARQGMRFDRAYLTASSCSPSRASIITGRYPHNTGAEQLHWPLPAESVTFVEKLKNGGYYAAAVGKWHLGNDVKDRFDLVVEADVAGFQLPSGDKTSGGRMVARMPSGCENWLSTLQNRPQSKPFFLWLAALDPHRSYEQGTLEPPHRLEDITIPPHLPDTPDVREDLRLYYDEIGRLDRHIGEVLLELETQRISDETIIIFISDNGRPFPRDKTTLYEGGIKTPLIIRWPGIVEAGSFSKSLVSAVDIAPTLLEIAGLENQESFEGISFLPLLKDRGTSVRDYIFAEDHWHDYEDHSRAVCNGRFKLIRNDYNDLPATPPADAGRSLTWQAMRRLHRNGQLTKAQMACFEAPRPQYELYDLVQDPVELNNLIDQEEYAAIRKELIDTLQGWCTATSDFIPSIRTPDEFDRTTGEPDHSVRIRPRPSKMRMYGTTGPY